MFLRPADTQDLDFLFSDLRDEDRLSLESMGGVDVGRAAADELMKHFPHQLFVNDDGRVAALWIGIKKWDGLVEIIGYTGNAAEDEIVGFYKASLRGIGYFSEFLGAHKVECIVWAGYDRSVKWLERLGFEKEGYMKHHGPDKRDAIMMGRTC